MLKEIKSKEFTNGKVYVLHTEDGLPIETTDTFLPYYTKDCINENSNKLKSSEIGSRKERWMIGVSVASGCNIGCRFCATGQMKRYRPLTAEEIVDQVKFILDKNPEFNPEDSKEFKINYTRCGEYSLNKGEVHEAIRLIDRMYPNVHHFVSTVGVQGDTFEWVKGNITLQISVHSLNEEYRDWLIPLKTKMTLKELGQIRVISNNKITLNLTLTNGEILDVQKLKKYFDPKYFFIKLSPLNENEVSKNNNMTSVIQVTNLV